MDLTEIMQYSHKIRKVNIKNENTNSQYTHVVIKIAINDKQDNEIIRFSMEEYGDWLNHQSNENDYFLRIPNKLESTITLFVHYFPSALYDYLEDQHIFSIYDWTELMDTTPISHYNNKTYLINDGYAFINNNMYLDNDNILYYRIDNEWHTAEFNNNNYDDGITINGDTYFLRNNKLIVNGEKYTKTIESNYYDYILDDEDKLVVRSYLSGSIDKFKNPNYKNYTRLVKDDEYVSNQTEQGFFPISSKYRASYRYITSPDINKNPLPYWKSTTNKASVDCSRANQGPYWQARINHKGLSPLISARQDNEYLPINVYLNYEYLPSSTEYHQHYYGFEPETEDEEYKKAKFTVLDSENLSTINSQFGQESTYRLVNYGNPFNDEHTMNVNHYSEKIINLKNGIPTNCTWEKNKCDDYYIYTPQIEDNKKGKVSINVELNENEAYRLQYYMYIPSESIVEYNSCYVEVEHEDMFGRIQKIDSISQYPSRQKRILSQDKILRDQWIYHEIDFIAEQNNRISIIGPQHNKDAENVEIEEGTIYQKEPHEKINDDKIFFTRFKLIKMEEYSPTLKYAGTGLYLAEQDQWTFKSTDELSNDECVHTDTTKTEEWITHIDDEDRWYKPQEPIPIPIKDVYIIFDDDFEILYNNITSELSWTAYKNDIFKFLGYTEYGDEGENTEGYLHWETDDNKISLVYDSLSNTKITNNNIPTIANDINKKGRITLYREQHKVFTTGINNHFTLRLQDSNGNPVIRGEIECTIWEQNTDENTCGPVKTLGSKSVDATGTVTYKKLNFKQFHPSDDNINYYLRIKYTNVCYDKEIKLCKKIFFKKEQRNMKAYINTLKTCNTPTCMCTLNNAENNNNCVIKACSIYDEEENKYILTQGDEYNIRNADIDLPIHIDVNIYNQLDEPIDEGYCELSINDELIQSTIVDSRGLADFYIDFEDIYKEANPEYHRYINDTHSIKIEYFDKYNETINFLYFDLTYTQDFDTRPVIPLNLYSIHPGLDPINDTPTIIDEEYEVEKNDIFMLNFDVEGINSSNNDFIIDIYKLNNNSQYILKEQINYSETNTNILMIGFDKYTNRNKDVYKIVVRSSNGISGQYRRYTKSFTIKWTDELSN